MSHWEDESLMKNRFVLNLGIKPLLSYRKWSDENIERFHVDVLSRFTLLDPFDVFNLAQFQVMNKPTEVGYSDCFVGY